MQRLTLINDTIERILSDLIRRNPGQYTSYENSVNEIIADIRSRKDEALFEYTRRFDGFDMDAEHIQVSDAEISEAYAQIDESLLAIMRRSKENIFNYHKKILKKTYNYSYFLL